MKSESHNTNIDIDSIDYSKYLDNPVVNDLYQERMENEGEFFDFDKLMDSADRLSKSESFERLFFTS